MVGQNGERFLQERYGTIKRAASFYNNQMLDHLNELMKKFISIQEMMFISTSDQKGNCDASFRAGPEGFVEVMDKKTLIYPEYKGNGVMASLGNITENPRIGLLFIDFFETQIGLHVNGKASIIESDQLQGLQTQKNVVSDLNKENGNKAERWVVVEVEEAYIHCSKHIPALQPSPSNKSGGTATEKQKDGDFFKSKQSNKEH